MRQALCAIAPWALLTLIFALPGVYLEWPSDPWAHLMRITEWATHPLVANHSAGYKSFYFFAYSWVGWLSPIHLLSWLNVYYVGVCLLLAWQYYLLANAVGLDRRWAFLSVIVNVLTFGNVCFSFYRYYALASTIFAQLGAVALTRIALEYARGLGQSAEGQGQKVKGEEQWDSRPLPVGGSAEQPHPISENQESKALPRRVWKPLSSFRALFTGSQPSTVDRPPCDSAAPSPSALRRGFAAGRLALSPLRARSAHYSLLRLGAASGALLLLIAFNHIQGIGIAGLGVAAVIIWRLIEWKRSTTFWLLILALGTSIVILLLSPPNSVVVALHRAGWLTAWYGFDLLSLHAPAALRAREISGLIGAINLFAGILLLCRRHVVGWLTVVPVLALCLPALSLPLATVLTQSSPGGIIAFHRFLFSVPCGMAIVIVSHSLLSPVTTKAVADHHGRRPVIIHMPRFHKTLSITLLTAFLALTIIPPSAPFYNRTWHLLAETPDDDALRRISADFATYSTCNPYVKSTTLAALSGISFALRAKETKSADDSASLFTYNRVYLNEGRAPSDDLEYIRGALFSNPTAVSYLVVAPHPNVFYTTRSITAIASHHWLPQEVVLTSVGSQELQAMSVKSSLHPVYAPGTLVYFRSDNQH